jgi:hypothetical protein
VKSSKPSHIEKLKLFVGVELKGTASAILVCDAQVKGEPCILTLAHASLEALVIPTQLHLERSSQQPATHLAMSVFLSVNVHAAGPNGSVEVPHLWGGAARRRGQCDGG